MNEKDAGPDESYHETRTVLERLARPTSRPDAATSPIHASPHPVEDAPVAPLIDQPLPWSEKTLPEVVECLPDAVVMVDAAGRIVLLNRQTESLFGFSREQLLGRPIEVLVPERLREAHAGHRQGFFHEPHVRPMGVGLELNGRRADGSEFPVEISLSPVNTEQGLFAVAVVRDVSQRKREEAKLRTLVENIPAVTFIAPLDESVPELYVSPQIEQLLGFSQKEWLEDPVLWYRQLHPDDRERWSRQFAPTCARGVPFKEVYRFLAKDGRVVWVHGSANVVRDAEGKPLFLQGVAFDISAIKEAEEELERQDETLRRVNAQLQNSVEEKEVLLKEIHHRVKNNLQVISSLLDLQSHYTADPGAVEMFRESQNRVRSMALIHERLYHAEDLSRVDFAEYIERLAEHLLQSYRVDSAAVQLDLHVSREVRLAIDTAVPCGLVVNELVSNSLKHAFPAGHGPGTIRVELHPLEDAHVGLRVADNGKGLPADVSPDTARTFGLQLVAMLVGQLRGTLAIERDHGTSFAIHFPLPKPTAATTGGPASLLAVSGPPGESRRR